MFGRSLSSMSQRDIEEGGERFYAAKGRANGEDREWDEQEFDYDYTESLLEDEPPVERITERDIDIAQEEALLHEEEMIIVEMIFVDPMERDY